MRFYDQQILPYLIHAAMQQPRFTVYRRRVVSAATGRVLEIGAGSGLNVPLYSATASSVVGLDPSPALVARARQAQRAPAPAHLSAPRQPTFLLGSADAIPLDTASVDTVVTTWTLCSIPDAPRALGEVRRVLRPSGRLLFVEHGRAPDSTVARWQDRLTPLWRRIAGGCHLNRAMDQLIRDSGFAIEQMTTDYMPGPRPMTFMYEGRARPI